MTQEPLRDNGLTIGNLSIVRNAYLKNGKINYDIAIERDESYSNIDKWIIPLNGQPADRYLDAIDQHWEILKREFQDIMVQTEQYLKFKTGKTNPKKCEELQSHALSLLAGDLLARVGTNKQLATGEIDPTRLPLTHLTARMTTIRDGADTARIKTDSFENAIEAIEDLNSFSISTLEEKLGLHDNDDHEFDTGLEDGREWDDEPHPWEQGSPEQEAYDHDADDDPEPEWKSSLHADDRPAWKAPSDIEDEREDLGGLTPQEDELCDALEEFTRHTTSFCHIANNIWIHATRQIAADKPVEVDPNQLEGLKETAITANGAYIRFQELAEQYHLQDKVADVCRAIEDAEEGHAPMMQKILSMANRPELLQDEITKALPRKRRL